MLLRVFTLLIASIFFVACGDDSPDNGRDAETDGERDAETDGTDFSELAAAFCEIEFECEPDDYASRAECEADAVAELEHATLYGSGCGDAMEDIHRCFSELESCDEYWDFYFDEDNHRCRDEGQRVFDHCGWYF